MVKEISGNGNTQVCPKILDNTTDRNHRPRKAIRHAANDAGDAAARQQAATLVPIQALSILNFYSKNRSCSQVDRLSVLPAIFHHLPSLR